MADTPSYLIPSTPKSADKLEEGVTRVTFPDPFNMGERSGVVIGKLGSMAEVLEDGGYLRLVKYEDIKISLD